MRFGLTTWTGDGTVDNGFRPAGINGTWAVIDLRPDPTVVDGLCFYAVEGAASGVRQDFGEESLDTRLSSEMRRAFANELRVDLSDLALKGLIAELLILHGDGRPIGTRTRWGRIGEDHRRRHRILLAGRVLFDAPVVEGVTITESFNQPDSTTVGPDLSWTEQEGDLETVSNTLRAVTNNDASTGRADTDLATDDHYSQAEATLTNQVTIIIAARIPSTAALTYYGFRQDRTDGSSGRYRLEKRISGSFTQLTSYVAEAASAGNVVRVEADGSTLTGLIDSVEKASTTDTDITGNTRCGMRLFVGAVAAQDDLIVDNFEAGDLGAAGITGTLAATQADNTAAFTGTVTAPAFTGTISTTQEDDTAAFSGTVVNPSVTGTVAGVQDDQTANFVGTVTSPDITGTIAATQDDDTAAFTGTVVNSYTGTIAATQADQTAAFTGTVTGILGDLTVTVGAPRIAGPTVEAPRLSTKITVGVPRRT